MVDSIEVPPEYRQLQYKKRRRESLPMWLRTSFISLAFSLCGLFWLIHSHAEFVTAWMIAGFVFAPFVVSAFFLCMLLAAVAFVRTRWTWDDETITINGHRYRWTSFQRFRMDQDVTTPDYASFKIQFRDRFLSKGIWFGITSYVRDIERLAKSARNHIRIEDTPPNSTGKIIPL